MTAVRTLIDRIGEGAEWYNTGGGCMAVNVPTPDGGYVLVSDRDDSFSHPDLESDNDVQGFAAFHYAPGYGETHNDNSEVYTSAEYTGPREEDYPDTPEGYAEFEREDAAHRAGWLVREAYACADAVRAYRSKVRTEPRAGMTGKQVVAVTSRDLPGGVVETTVTTWDRQSGNESWTFTEHPAEGGDQ